MIPKSVERSGTRKLLVSLDGRPVRTSRAVLVQRALFGDLGNYGELMRRIQPLISDDRWIPYGFPPERLTHAWYYIVYKPFNRDYEKKRSFFESKKWIDFVRKRHSDDTVKIISVEKMESKHHINVLCYSTRNLSLWHGINISGKGKLHVQMVENTHEDRHNVLAYMFKEAKQRLFVQYDDYYFHEKSISVRSASDACVDPMEPPDSQVTQIECC